MTRRPGDYPLPTLLRSMLAARRVAVTRGEVTRMWPGAAWDLVTLTWWRGIYWPVVERIAPTDTTTNGDRP